MVSTKILQFPVENGVLCKKKIMITIYHNPRCSKSREGLQLLENKQLPFAIHKYLDQPLSEKELLEIIEKLGIAPMGLVRRKESVWKEQFAGKPLTDEEIIKALLTYPQLIERPIVVVGEKAVIARPAERIKELF